ncbi:MAG: hypothetical protein A2Z30_02750 [Chloroflexi bacterium RBG_16_64_43]|nr:MAG: hypothetical protein A2Z30_02750 [Chloroflexi bacterium RBG_16_64_43]
MRRKDIRGVRPALLRALLGALILLSVVAGGLTYWGQSRRIRDQAGAQLTTIAELKVGQIQLWREERLSDGQVILADGLRLSDLTHVLRGTAAHAGRTDALKWLGAYQAGLNCVDVLLVGTDGKVTLSAAYSVPPGEAYDVNLIERALTGRVATLTDFYRDANDGNIYIDLIVPIVSGGESPADRVGAVVERFDPRAFLFPLIQS